MWDLLVSTTYSERGLHTRALTAAHSMIRHTVLAPRSHDVRDERKVH